MFDIVSFVIARQKKGESSGVITELEVSENGTFRAPSGIDGFSPVVVNVPNDTETLTVTRNGSYTPSESHIGFSAVNVVIPTYDGTVIVSE